MKVILLGKRGTSLVEIIAVIIIMGIIVSITTIVATSVITRQRKNAVVNALNEIYKSATSLLIQVSTGSFDENITVEEDCAYVSLTTLIDSGNVDGSNYKPLENEIYFYYDMQNVWVVITNNSDSLPSEKPSTTGEAVVNSERVTFNYEKNLFKIA